MLMADIPTISCEAETRGTAKILPETGRGTTKWWRGPMSEQNSSVRHLGTPPSLCATSPFRGGFSGGVCG